MNYRRSLVILLLFCPLIYAQAKDTAIVAGGDTAANGLHSADIAKAIKGSSHKMPNGKPMIIVLKPAQSVETRIFGEKCLGQNEKELSALISSEHALFRVVASDQEVIKAVNAIPGSIGLVDVYSINSSVTVLKIDNKSPLEPGYLFHGN
jgi:ABC-type phosphate transport system substrate-binding protein